MLPFELDFSTVLILVLSVLFLLYYFSGPRNVPPGPRAWPGLGNLPTFAANKGRLPEASVKLAERYGNIFCLLFGNIRIAVILGYDLITEALLKKSEIFSARPSFMWFVDKQGTGLVYSNGKEWEDMRRLVVQSVQGRISRLEVTVQDEIKCMLGILQESEGKPINTQPHFTMAMFNILCGVIFGTRFDYEDEAFQSLYKGMRHVITTPVFSLPENGLPILRYIPRPKSLSREIFRSLETAEKIFRGYLDDHKATYDQTNIRDLFDMYIKFKNEEKETSFNESNFFRMIVDLFQAGTATSSANLQWLVLYMAAYPEVQTKCQTEIDRVVPKQRKVVQADMSSLPFVRATIMEVQRLANITPFSVPHATLENTELGGYNIPKKTVILVNLMSIHMDPKLWPEPEIFKPERFLNDKGEVIEKKGFYPFSLGSRACAGEALVQMELFLYFSNLLKHFSVKKPEGVTLTFEGFTVVSRQPKPFEIIPVKRG